MSATASAIIERRAAAVGKPGITYRYAGDRAVLVEYGEMEFDLTLNFFVQAVDDALRGQPLEGLIETAPGFRSILVTYDPLVVSTGDLLAHLEAVTDELARRARDVDPEPARPPSCRVRRGAEPCGRGPLHQHDPQGRSERRGRQQHRLRRALQRLRRPRGALQRRVSTEHWAAFIGFFPGLPFMFPLDARHVVVAPKYNPTRTWTAEGALGVGGPCWAIYPVESAGGYQIVGRTLPIYDVAARNEVFRENPLLLRAADRVQFHRVEEAELLELWRGRARRPLPLPDRGRRPRRRRPSRVGGRR